MNDLRKLNAFEVKGLTPNPKNYYPNKVGIHRIGNGTPEGVEALRKSLERSAKK